MGRQIIKQPNGLYAIWSTVVDHFVLYDATADEIVDEAIRENSPTREGVLKVIEELNNGGKPYYQFTMTFKEAIQTARRIHGKDDETLQDILKRANERVDPSRLVVEKSIRAQLGHLTNTMKTLTGDDAHQNANRLLVDALRLITPPETREAVAMLIDAYDERMQQP